MSFDWSIVSEGKKAVFPETVRIYFDYPESDDYKTLPKGEPTGEISGYVEPNINGIETKFLQIQGSQYVKLIPGVKYVSADYSGSGNLFEKTFYFFSDTAGNLTNDVKKAGGYLADGWRETKSRSFFEMLDFAGFNSVKKAIIIGGVLLGTILLIQILSKIK